MPGTYKQHVLMPGCRPSATLILVGRSIVFSKEVSSQGCTHTGIHDVFSTLTQRVAADLDRVPLPSIIGPIAHITAQAIKLIGHDPAVHQLKHKFQLLVSLSTLKKTIFLAKQLRKFKLEVCQRTSFCLILARILRMAQPHDENNWHALCAAGTDTLFVVLGADRPREAAG